ncbi:MAG: DoxX family protein [Gammaproteobacteria bacterium]|nr:DoxX family protein [Gammaproteobacteria bacterium]
MNKVMTVAARALLAAIFILAGVGKLGAGYAGTAGYMTAMGVPAMLLPLVILLEIGGGLALLMGWKTRWAAAALAGFTVVAALIFHRNVADQIQMIMFLKNLAISGGLLLLVIHGAGAPSVDDASDSRGGNK